MSTPHIIQTVIEFLLIGLLIAGFINKHLIIRWERKMIKKIIKNKEIVCELLGGIGFIVLFFGIIFAGTIFLQG